MTTTLSPKVGEFVVDVLHAYIYQHTVIRLFLVQTADQFNDRHKTSVKNEYRYRKKFSQFVWQSKYSRKKRRGCQCREEQNEMVEKKNVVAQLTARRCVLCRHTCTRIWVSYLRLLRVSVFSHVRRVCVGFLSYWTNYTYTYIRSPTSTEYSYVKW